MKKPNKRIKVDFSSITVIPSVIWAAAETCYAHAESKGLSPLERKLWFNIAESLLDDANTIDSLIPKRKSRG